jgi:hypothetical protein
MADFFANKYWSQGYWSVKYFQGGQQATGAMSADIVSTTLLDATLTYTSFAVERPISNYAPYRIIREKRKVYSRSIRARIISPSAVVARLTARGQLRSEIECVCSIKSTLTAKRNYATADAAFWIMAA